MTTGIYALYWEEQDLIYIGLSQGIEGRYKDHLRDMKKQKHTNYKIQNAFNSYGIPTLFILEECLIDELNAKEIQWMAEFDALGKQGLCIVEGGRVGFGTNSNSSKYSRRQVLKVFSLLYKTILPQTKIAKKLNIDKQVVTDIAGGRSHFWLQDVYPEKYSLMIENKEQRRAKGVPNAFNLGVTYPKVVDPYGVVYQVINIIEFCRGNPLLKENLDASATGLGRLLRFQRNQYKGWKIFIGEIS